MTSFVKRVRLLRRSSRGPSANRALALDAFDAAVSALAIDKDPMRVAEAVAMVGLTRRQAEIAHDYAVALKKLAQLFIDEGDLP